MAKRVGRCAPSALAGAQGDSRAFQRCAALRRCGSGRCTQNWRLEGRVRHSPTGTSRQIHLSDYLLARRRKRALFFFFFVGTWTEDSKGRDPAVSYGDVQLQRHLERLQRLVLACHPCFLHLSAGIAGLGICYPGQVLPEKSRCPLGRYCLRVLVSAESSDETEKPCKKTVQLAGLRYSTLG